MSLFHNRGDDTDNSSYVTTSSLARRFNDSDHESSPISPPSYRLPMSVIGRLQLEKEAGGSGSCSSSADSTPKKRPGLPPKPILPIPASFPPKAAEQQKPQILQTLPLNGGNVDRNAALFAQVPPSAKPPPPSRLAQQLTKKPSLGLSNPRPNSRFFGFESESCSSAVSSLDSVCSGSSDGLGNSRSNSDLGSITSALVIPGRTQLPPKTLMAKFQVKTNGKSKCSSSVSTDESRDCGTRLIQSSLLHIFY